MVGLPQIDCLRTALRFKIIDKFLNDIVFLDFFVMLQKVQKLMVIQSEDSSDTGTQHYSWWVRSETKEFKKAYFCQKSEVNFAVSLKSSYWASGYEIKNLPLDECVKRSSTTMSINNYHRYFLRFTVS